MAARKVFAGREVVHARPVSAWTWRDPAVAVEALGARAYGHALTADVGGDLAFALAIAGAASVTHAAPGLSAFALAELKLVAARELPVEGYRCLLGLDPAGRRVFFYHLLRSVLSEPSRAFWDRNEELIRLGLATCGTLERHVEGFRLRALPLAHRAATVERALSITDPVEAKAFFAGTWDSAAWRAACRAWFASPVHRALGLPAFGSGWLGRLVEHAGTCPPATNFLAHFALRGALPDLEAAWPQLSTRGHEALASAARRVHLVQADPAALLSERGADTFEAVVLDAVSPASPVLSAATRRLRAGARVVAWVLGEPPVELERAKRDREVEASLGRRDRSALCGPLLVARIG